MPKTAPQAQAHVGGRVLKRVNNGTVLPRLYC